MAKNYYMGIDIEKFQKLFEAKGFEFQEEGKTERSQDDFIKNIVMKFSKDNILIEVRTYVLELIIRFKNTNTEFDYIDILDMMYYYELKENIKPSGNFFSNLFCQEIEKSLIEELNYIFLKKKLNDIILLLNDINIRNTLKVINSQENKLTKEKFSKTYFFNKKNFKTIINKYK